jgi:hypothetical protein
MVRGQNLKEQIMNSKDLAIGVLSTTAVVLFVGLILLHGSSQPALAGVPGVQSGDYVLAVGAVDTRTQVLFVIDTAVNGMNVYGFDFKSGSFGITDKVDLGAMRAQMRGMTPGRR